MDNDLQLFEREPLDPVAEMMRLRTLVQDLETRLSQAYGKIRSLEDKLYLIDVSKREVEALRRELDDRYHEIVVLTTLAAASEDVRIRFRSPGEPTQSASKIVARLRTLVRREGRSLRKEAVMVRRCGLFDEAWYLQRYPDVVDAGMDPVEHYLAYGAAEGRDPSPSFSTSQYRLQHPAIMQSNVNPLVHFIRNGMARGRNA